MDQYELLLGDDIPLAAADIGGHEQRQPLELSNLQSEDDDKNKKSSHYNWDLESFSTQDVNDPLIPCRFITDFNSSPTLSACELIS